MVFGIRNLETIKGYKKDHLPSSSSHHRLCRFLSLARQKCCFTSSSELLSESNMTIPESEPMMDIGICEVPATVEEERRIVTDLVKEAECDLKVGNLYYIVSTRWFKSWKMYVGLVSSGESLEAARVELSSEESLEAARVELSSEGSLEAARVELSSGECLEAARVELSSGECLEAARVELSSGECLEAARPGPIENDDIIEVGSDASDPQLRLMLEEGVDYDLVPEQVWRKLVEWYKGGPTIPRKMISQQSYHGKVFSVEVYPLCLRLTDGRDNSSVTIRLSKQASIRQLYEMVCALKGVEKEKAHIWDYYGKRKERPLEPLSELTMQEISFSRDQDILLEVDESESSTNDMSLAGNELALVPFEAPVEASVSDPPDIIITKGTYSNGHSYGSMFNFFGTKEPEDDTSDSSRGLAGLQNLGNTCFMNSTLQCLAHTPPIFEYFLQDYTNDLNTENPLGMRGELAIAFGELLRKLWSCGSNTVAPRNFKAKLARFAPQFSGYNQHDSQEMLSFLLDGLHEDLNKVKQKPYIEAKDSDGRPDDEVAEELWKYHKARNDSVIVDVCQGQYKSTLVCPDCGKISITFDPFMYLTLPLPISQTRSMMVSVFYGDESCLWTPYTVTVPKDGCCKDLSDAIATACCLNDDESLLFAEVYMHKIFRYIEDPLEPLQKIANKDLIVAYRFNHMDIGPGKVKLEIRHGELQTYVFYSRSMSPKLFGTPLVTYINAEALSGTDIDTIISELMSHLNREYSSSEGEENSHIPDVVSDETSGSLSSEDIEMDTNTADDRELSFTLILTEQYYKDKPIKPDSVVNPGSVTTVLVQWNKKEHEKYDCSYMENIPQVYKRDFSVKEEEVSIFSCLEAFLAEEPLGPDDMWYCPCCKEHRQANKKLDLWNLPDILVFHLKRFTYSEHFKNKIGVVVDFPIHDLDLSKYVKNKDSQTYLYELYAISNHLGGLCGGHYTAYAKLMDDNEWYNFDDNRVYPVKESKIKTSSAYVLFYKRVKSEPATSNMEFDGVEAQTKRLNEPETSNMVFDGAEGLSEPETSNMEFDGAEAQTERLVSHVPESLEKLD